MVVYIYLTFYDKYIGPDQKTNKQKKITLIQTMYLYMYKVHLLKRILLTVRLNCIKPQQTARTKYIYITQILNI